MNRKDNCLDIQNYQFVQLNGKIVHLFSQIFVQFFPVSFLEFNNFEVLFHVFSWILKEILDLCWNLTIQLHLWTVLICAWPAFLISRISVVSNKIKSENENVVIFFLRKYLLQLRQRSVPQLVITRFVLSCSFGCRKHLLQWIQSISDLTD